MKTARRERGFPGSRERGASPRARPRSRQRGLVALLTFCVGLLAGCAGSGRVQIAALNFQAIDPPAGPAPRFAELPLDRCTWWLDEQGKVWIAMERAQTLWLGPEWQFRFQLSLALDEPPAGRSREYLVSRREMRATTRFGPSQSRFASINGIVALYREPNNQLRGSFRLQVAREVQQLLGNWSTASRYLMMGTFVAVPDDGRGRQIARATEDLGGQREPPTPTQPSPP